MSLDKLAVIFVIIILPISVILSSYTTEQVEALRVQSMYDTKLYAATYDAVKSFQLNTFNEDTSDLANSRIRLVKASANAFLTSLASNFNMHGYTQGELQNYVPALVFTMYDGYYIYSKYTNTLDIDYPPDATKITYGKNDIISGVKPFIYYSSRYKRGTNDDFVITYTLDNYITIQGMIGGNPVNDSGYLVSGVEDINVSAHTLKYHGFPIGPETLKEYVGDTLYEYHKINGRKYYYDEEENKWFYMQNGAKRYTPQRFKTGEDNSAFNYYYQAKLFTDRVQEGYKLGNLTVKDNCIDAKNNPDVFSDSNMVTIFDFSNIEAPDSSFNVHRTAVIRYTIEKNLSIAIANYNNFFNGSANSNNFQMPKLKEDEWAKIYNNISVISFMQGMPIGGFKTYNGCVVMPNNKNAEVVAETSIYLATGDNGGNNMGTYYSPLDNDIDGSGYTGVYNIDLERKYFYDDSSGSVQGDYYYPKFYLADYGSVVTSSNITADVDSIYEYFTKTTSTGHSKTQIASAYFTALGRERFSTYNVHKIAEVELERDYE